MWLMFCMHAASLKVKADKERQMRDSVCKQLVEGKRTIGKLCIYIFIAVGSLDPKGSNKAKN